MAAKNAFTGFGDSSSSNKVAKSKTLTVRFIKNKSSN